MTDKKRKVIRIGLFLLAGVFTFLGIWRGEVDTMFVKAVNICLECIGIG